MMQTQAPKSGDTIAILKTNRGVMKAVLFTDIVADAASNFVELAKQGKYTDVPFHRVIKNFVIQGGDFTRKNGTGGHSAKGPGTQIGDQYHPELKHIYGALSWAKTSMPNSIGSQFFVVNGKGGAHFLDHPAKGGPAEGYSVFGQVFEGFEVLDAISAVRTDSGDRPAEDQILESVEIEVLA
jgi:peptidyl-prolyl cis-trans isomerase B (cyclophilin B)